MTVETEIELPRGRNAIIDVIDADLANVKWSAPNRSNNRTVYCQGRYNGKSRAMHRVILSRILGRELETHEHVDHINGNGLDNRRGNLRLANKKQNIGNSRKHKDSKNPYKGISTNGKATSKSWRSQIFIDGKSKSLGGHKTAELAHRAYCVAALRYWGSFANFGENSPFKGWSIQQLLAYKTPELPLAA